MAYDYLIPRSAPEAQGVSSRALLDFLEDVRENIHDLHSFMLLRHGAVVAEGWWAPYGPEIPHMLFSLTKSFTSTAVGLAVSEGRLSVDDPVLSFFPKEAPPNPSDHLKAMRLRHLLSMSTGHDQDTTGKMVRRKNWARAFLSLPVEHEPGTHFVYNSGASYMLSAIVQKVTGMTLLEYLTPRLFEPLGIQGAAWETCPRGVNIGGWGLMLKTEDIARFGQLYLQRGMWRGKRLLPAAWVDEASSKQVSNGSQPDSDWEQGYGYQFWRCRHHIYRGDGAFGQYCIVMPDQDAVLAITSGVGDMQAVLNKVWQHLLPAMHPAALPEDRPAQNALLQALSCLALEPRRGMANSPLAEKVSGKKYFFAKNRQKLIWASFDFSEQGCVYTTCDGRGEHRLESGINAWKLGTTDLEMGITQPVAAGGGWIDDRTFEMTQCFYTTPFMPVMTCRFAGDTLTLDYTLNVSFGPAKRPTLVGKLVPQDSPSRISG